MLSEYTKFKLNRRLRNLRRHGQRQTERLESEARTQVFKRFKNLRPIRNFVIAWVGFVLVMFFSVIWQWQNLQSNYQKLNPEPGGTFVEGIVGMVTNINPIFALDGPDAAAAKLIFNGLLYYDERGQLVNDLAENVEISEDGTRYTIRVRSDVQWHDGVAFTSEDVAFTFRAIAHPDTRSPLNTSWRDVTILTPDKQTVIFILPNPFSPFLNSLTTAIVPRHILEPFGFSGLRPAEFNQAPVGTGPFRFSRLDSLKNEVTLVANDKYYRGRPKLDRFIIKTYPDYQIMSEAYSEGVLVAMVDQPFGDSSDPENQSSRSVHSVNISSTVFGFYNNSRAALTDPAVRRALTVGIPRRQIVSSLNYQFSLSNSPLLPSQLGYNHELVQPKYDQAAARQTLEAAGWVAGSDGIRVKNGLRLGLSLVTQDSEEYRRLTEVLKTAWAELGVDTKVGLYPNDELQQSFVKTHDYDVLVYAIANGSDPDVFAYWHSTQATPPGFNLSEYKNAIADESLDAGRTRTNPELRKAKYKAFLEQWRNDLPAVALVQRQFLYVQHPNAVTFANENLIDTNDRFNNVELWTVRQTRK